MQSPSSPLNTAFSLLTLGAVGVAIWLARRVMVVAAAHDLPGFPYPLPRRGSAALLLWMILSALMFVPLNDALRVLQSLPSIFVPGEWSAESPTATAWGTAPWPLYLVLLDVVLLVAYAVAFFYLRSPTPVHGQSGGMDPQARTAAFLLTLGGGGLLARFLQSIFISVVWLPIAPRIGILGQGIAGFLVGWVLALMLLVAVLVVMNSRPLLVKENTAAA